jgi:DNA-3-methyladenine glycosylase II
MPKTRTESDRAPAAAVGLAASGAPVPAYVVPPYWDEACKHLKRRDRVLKRLIPMFGEARLQSRGDAFTTLARSVVGQQISTKAAQAVWNRFSVLVSAPASVAPAANAIGAEPATTQVFPDGVLALGNEALRSAGLSARKCEYLKDLALHFVEGRVHQDQWQAMDDETIIQELVAIRGIGRWTAEMFLMFHLLRPDVLPLDDLGVLKGISLNYFSGEPVTRAEARDVAEAWTPYRSVATWYLWRSLDPVPVDY